MVSDERAEQAFEYLSDTTERIGDAKGALERAEILRKRARKAVFLSSTGTVAERDALAENSESAQKADDEYISALVAYEKVKAKREIEAIALDVWRTLQASKRKGFL